MLCIVALDKHVPRIGPTGKGRQFTGLTPPMQVDCIPRPGEILLVEGTDGVPNEHTVTSVRYKVMATSPSDPALTFMAYVFVSEGTPAP